MVVQGIMERLRPSADIPMITLGYGGIGSMEEAAGLLALLPSLPKLNPHPSHMHSAASAFRTGPLFETASMVRPGVIRGHQVGSAIDAGPE